MSITVQYLTVQHFQDIKPASLSGINMAHLIKLAQEPEQSNIHIPGLDMSPKMQE